VPPEKKKLRVLHLIGSAESGGAEQFFLRLMLAFARRPDELKILPVVRSGSWLAGQLRRAGVRHEEASFNRWNPFARKAIAAVAAEWQPTVVTAWMKRAALMTPQGPWPTVGRLGGYYGLRYFRGRVKYLVGNTPDICHHIREEGWPGDAVAYLPNFIPAPPPGWRDGRAVLRQRLGVPPNGILLLVAGRLHKVKGIDIALRALASLGERYHLLLVGDGPEEKRLHKMAAQLEVEPRVHWVGWQAYLSPWAGAADFWLVPSREEPLGNTVLDAWAHGIAVIATRSKGPAHLIEHGVNGRLAKVDDPLDLAAEVRELAERRVLATRLVTGGQNTWRQKFSENGVVEQWLEYYERLLKENTDTDD
jgi:glycosyltransferase involved in cell wall biosynthesis